jgi:hypothetical protein
MDEIQRRQHLEGALFDERNFSFAVLHPAEICQRVLRLKILHRKKEPAGKPLIVRAPHDRAIVYFDKMGVGEPGGEEKFFPRIICAMHARQKFQRDQSADYGVFGQEYLAVSPLA